MILPPLEFPAESISQRQTIQQGILKGGSIIVPLNSCLTGLDYSVLQIKTKMVSCLTAYSPRAVSYDCKMFIKMTAGLPLQRDTLQQKPTA